MLDLQKFNRRTFEVEAIQIELSNIHEIAEWCGGTIEERPHKMLGTEALLPVINLKGVGADHANYYIGHLKCWVVKMKKTFRIYKPEQFDRTFVKMTGQWTIQDIENLIMGAGFELYGNILPAGTVPCREPQLSEKVNDAIDKALEIAKNQLDTRTAEELAQDIAYDEAEAQRDLEPKAHNTECEV
jgi:hypothetical protein